MDIGEFLVSGNRFDLLVLVGLFGLFVLGYIQGTVRRLVGILGILLAFLLAANLQEALGEFLAANWYQFEPEYSRMLGFATLFGAGVVASSAVIQGTLPRYFVVARFPVIDEILGGLLGIVQGVLLLALMTIVLDQYFLLSVADRARSDEIEALRSLWRAIDGSGTGVFLRESIIPVLVAVFGIGLPATLKSLYER